MIRGMKTWKDLLLAGMAVLCLAACSSDNDEIVPEPEPEPTVPPLVTDYQDPMFEDFECYPEGTAWEEMDGYLEGYNPDFCIIYRFEVKGDTAIQGIDYKKVNAQMIRQDTIHNGDDRDSYIERDREEHYTFAIREEKGRIYKWNATYGKDALFYDFNWKSGLPYFVYSELTDEYITGNHSVYDVFEEVTMENGDTYESFRGQIKTIGILGWGGIFCSYPSGTLGIGFHQLLSFTRNGQLLYRNHNLDRYFENKENENEQGD